MKSNKSHDVKVKVKNYIRKPPAFQMYASDRLADRNFRKMLADERGVLHSIELEFWVNGSVPVDLDEMARILCFSKLELEAGFTRRVRKYLKEMETPEGRVYVVPELEDYRIALEAKRAQQSEAGKETAKKRAAKRSDESSANSQASSSASSYAISSLSGGEVHGNDVSGTERKSAVFSEAITVEHLEFLVQNDGEPEFLR